MSRSESRLEAAGDAREMPLSKDDVRRLSGEKGVTPPILNESPAAGSQRSGGSRSSASGEAYDKILLQVITFQGWLVRFAEPRVRRDYLGGKMGVAEYSDELLWSIDRIKEIMLPSPYRSRDMADDPALLGRNFFARFIARDNSAEPTDHNGGVLPVQMTYAEWYVYLGKLSSSSYWQVTHEFPCSDRYGGINSEASLSNPRFPIGVPEVSVRPKTRMPVVDDVKAHDLWERRSVISKGLTAEDRKRTTGSPPLLRRQELEAGGRGERVRPAGTNVFTRGSSDDMSDRRHGRSRVRSRPSCSGRRRSSDDMSDHRRGQSRVRSRPSRSGRRQVNRGLEYGSSSDSSGGISQERNYRDSRMRRREYESMVDMFRRMKFQKEVVSPGKFDGRDGTSLREFLREYEAYFASKYEGSEKQQARTLGEHLSGAARKAYEAMGGSTLRYSVLKPELLSWYQGERSNTQMKSESEFRKARMAQGDSFKIYAMRLERLACRAFPDSVAVRERQLCRKLWKTTPEDFQQILSSNERSLSLHGVARRLSWGDMVRLAESEDRFRRDRREDVSSDSRTEDDDRFVWYSRPDSGPAKPKRPVRQNDERRGKSRVSFGPVFPDGIAQVSRSPNSDSVRGSPTRKLTICDWCGRRGHQEEGCWTKAGACMICGSGEHSKDDCPRFDREWGGFVPTCSLCGGPHLGKDCESKLNL